MAPGPASAADDSAQSGTLDTGDSGAASSEVITVTGAAPAPAGTIALEAVIARQTAGALGEPFRAVALLPGVTTSVAASGYPVIRGSLPGESRYSFDGIEIPMLYHLLLGNQVIHPSFIGEIDLRAGGHGAEQGNLIGGLIAMKPTGIDQPRTELRANPIEVGAFRAQPLSDTTAIVGAVRFGTLAGAVKLYDSKASLYYVDQQTRLVHRLDDGDELALTGLGAYDYLRQPPDRLSTKTDRLGFYRLDGRWTRRRAGRQLRAGVEVGYDTFGETDVPLPVIGPDGLPLLYPIRRQGGRAYGVRAYTDGRLDIASWATVRAGAEARHRTLINGENPFTLSPVPDPFLSLARRVDAAAAWAALELRVGPLQVTPGIRVDDHHADLYGASVGHISVDPRLAIAADLPAGARAELAGGIYTAPPQASEYIGNIVIGPLPMLDGAASAAGMNRGAEVDLSLHTPLGAGLQGSFAAYYRQTHYAVDFSMFGTPFAGGDICSARLRSVYAYRDITARAIGAEVMIRRELGRSVTGWLSYSLGKIDRDFGFIRLPGAFDQRHTLNATGQWTHGPWRFGATGHLHTGRAVSYPQIESCGSGYDQSFESAARLRRLPTTYRLDLRAERAFEAAGWRARLFLELQNATLTPEVTGYAAEAISPNSPRRHVVEDTLFLPLPLLGLEVVL